MDFKELSKKNYGLFQNQEKPNLEQVQVGALQRIADASEKLSDHLIKIIQERDYYKRWYESEQKRADKLRRQLAAAKGQIKRLKNRIN